MQLSIKQISIFLFGIVVFFLTRQIPFGSLSSVSNVALIGLFTLVIYKKPEILKNNIWVFIWLGILIGYSLICQNEVKYIIRFSIIFVLIILAYNIAMPIQILKIFYFFVIFQAIIVIVFEIILLLFFSQDTYMPIRFFFLERQWGDIYTYSGMYYLIQMKGNALLPFAYMFTFVLKFSSLKKKWLLRITLFLGVIFVGNFAFFISLFVFHLFRYIYIQGLSYNIAFKRILLIMIIGIITIPIIYTYTQETLKRKSDVSLGTRSDQFNVLVTDLCENLVTLSFGQGLGNTLSVITSFRDYTDNVYFELQAVYFINQIGIVNFLIFLIVNVYLAVTIIKNKSLLWLYCCYIIYAITNPYILDTSHVVVIIMLVSINKYYNENRLHISHI